MSYIGWNILMAFLLFQGILSSQLDMPDYFSYWDEFFCFILFIFWILKLVVNNYHSKKNTLKIVYPWFVIILIGLLGNAIFKYAVPAAIIRDMVGYLKFPISFFAVRELGWDTKIARSLKKVGFIWIKIITIIMFICGVLCLYFDFGMNQEEIRMGIHPYQFLFHHPTVLVSVSVMCICLFYADEHRKKYFMYIIMLTAIIVLSMRTKGLAFVAVFIFIRYGSSWMRRYKVMYWGSILAVVIAAFYSKLQLYMSYSSSGREVLWIGGFNLLRMCFPIGSGFGSFASHISGRYRSVVYSFIKSADFLTFNGEATSVLGDTGFPYYIGQFGVAGIIVLIIAVWRMLGIWHLKNDEEWHYGSAEDLLMVYIAIALTSESVLLSFGCEYGVVLAVLLKLDVVQRVKNTGL